MNTRLYQKPGSGEAVEPPGRIRAEKDNTLNWFVMEIFHVEECEDGSVILTNRFGSPVQVCEDGGLWSMKPGEGTPFRMEVVKDGQAAAVELAKGKEAVVLALGCNSMINAKEEVDRGTIELPPAQRRLMEAVYEANRKVVMVLFQLSLCYWMGRGEAARDCLERYRGPGHGRGHGGDAVRAQQPGGAAEHDLVSGGLAVAGHR